jgi:hypothetical protein
MMGFFYVLNLGFYIFKGLVFNSILSAEFFLSALVDRFDFPCSVPINLTFTERATGLGLVVRVFGPASRDKGEARG